MSSETQALANSLDVVDTTNLLVKALKSDHSNSYYYDRDPKIHHYIQTVFRPEFEKFGIDTWVDDYGNLIARVGERKTGKRVLIIQHAMEWGPSEEESSTLGTIHSPGEVLDAKDLGIEGFEPEKYGVNGKVVWGRGGCEATGGTIAAVEAAKMIARSGIKIPGEALFIITSGGHSAASDNIFHLLINDEIKADMAVHQGVQNVTIGGVGRIDLRLTILGRVSHSSYYGDGLNAAQGAYIALERLQKIMPCPSEKRHPSTGVAPRLTNIGMETFPKPPGHLTGTGSTGHALQSMARILLDRRILPNETVDEAVEQIRNAIGDLSPFKYRIERGAYHFPWGVSKDAPVVKVLTEAVRSMLGKEPEIIHRTACWDMGAVNKLGIPCVTYGTTGPMVVDPPIGPHTENDFATVNWVCNAAKVYACFALKGTSA